MTKQRRAILACLKNAKRPLSIEEILNEISIEVPKINLSTVYRNLKEMIQEEVVHALDLPGNCARYEILVSTHKHHFLCDTCNRLYNISTCPKDIALMVPNGFKMVNHLITLNGVCRECNTK